MSKKTYLISAAAVVIVIAAAASGYRVYSESQYYKLVSAQESAARSYFNNIEAFGASSETLGINMDAATASSVSPASAQDDIAKAETALNSDQTSLKASPASLANWKSTITKTNSRLKSLWVSSRQRQSIRDINTQELSIISAAQSNTATVEDLVPAMQESLNVMKASILIGQFSNNNSSQASIQANFSQLSSLAPYAASGYTYPGESGVKAKFPTVDATVAEADKAVGDSYVLYQDLANNELLAALALAPQVQNEANRLTNASTVLNSLNKQDIGPLDKTAIAAATKLQTDVSSSSDKRLVTEIGLRKYEAAAVTGALDLYSFDHTNANKDNLVPAESTYSGAVAELKKDGYLAAGFNAGSGFTYTVTDANRSYSLTYTDDLTGQTEKTGA